MLDNNKLYLGDSFDLMNEIPDHSIDMILTDPPYNCTICEFDKEIINIDLMWQQFKRIIKPGGNILIHAKQPFSTKVINGNLNWFKYSVVWAKSNASNFLQTQKRLGCIHEDILIFYDKFKTFNPQENKEEIIEAQHRKQNDKYNQNTESVINKNITTKTTYKNRDSVMRENLIAKSTYNGRTIIKQSKPIGIYNPEGYGNYQKQKKFKTRYVQYLYKLYNSVLYFPNQYGKLSGLHRHSKTIKTRRIVN